MALTNYDDFELALTKFCDLFEGAGFENISITNDPDYIEVASDRDMKFPAIYVIGPKIRINKFTKGQGLYGDVFEKDKEKDVYIKKRPPLIVDLIFKFIILGQTDLEVLNAVINVLDIFDDEVTITVKDTKYRVYMTDELNVNNLTNISDLITAEGSAYIEGFQVQTKLDEEEIPAAVELVVNSNL